MAVAAIVIAVRVSGTPPGLLLRAPLVFNSLGALPAAVVVAAEPQWSISVNDASMAWAASGARGLR